MKAAGNQLLNEKLHGTLPHSLSLTDGLIMHVFLLRGQAYGHNIQKETVHGLPRMP